MTVAPDANTVQIDTDTSLADFIGVPAISGARIRALSSIRPIAHAVAIYEREWKWPQRACKDPSVATLCVPWVTDHDLAAVDADDADLFPFLCHSKHLYVLSLLQCRPHGVFVLAFPHLDPLMQKSDRVRRRSIERLRLSGQHDGPCQQVGDNLDHAFRIELVAPSIAVISLSCNWFNSRCWSSMPPPVIYDRGRQSSGRDAHLLRSRR